MKLQAVLKHKQEIPYDSTHHTDETTSKIVSVIISGLIFFTFATIASVVLVVLSPLWLLSTIIDHKRIALHFITSRLLFGFMHINPFWRCHFWGLPNLYGKQPAVIVVNHQSVGDIVVLSGLPIHFKWVAKSQIFQIPLINLFMMMLGCICLNTDTISSTKKMMRECKQLLNQGVSVLLFPEGTRTEDGKLLPFKEGPFKLAVECNVPIIPIVVTGTREIWPKHSRRLALAGEIQVKVLPAISPQSAMMNEQTLTSQVRTVMQKALQEMRGQQRKLHVK